MLGGGGVGDGPVDASARAGALGLLAVLLAACGSPSGEGQLDYGVRHDNVGELVASADAVVVGRVTATSRGQVLDEEDVVYTIMNVTLAVEQRWVGRRPASSFTIERLGWERVARRPGWRAGSTTPATGNGGQQAQQLLEQGDRGILFLAREPGRPGWSVLGPEGLYLVDGTELTDTGRADPTVRTVESMTVSELQTAVAEAAAAVSRGRLQPKRPPGG